MIPERYSFVQLSDNISLDDILNVKKEAQNIQLNHETSSIITRIKLWSTSIKMIEENPILGVGVGRWNKEKHNYGFTENVLIDSHNDFLAYLSQYGIITGALFIYFMFIFPLIIYFKLKKTNYKSKLMGLSYINGGMFIAAFSNAGSFKHQIYGLLIFNIFCLFFYYNYLKNKSSISNQTTTTN